MKVLKAAFLYFLIVFAAGFATGTIRVVLLAPGLGETAAVMAELPLMTAISWWVCGWVLRWQPLAKAALLRFGMGFLALLFLLAGETAVSLGLGGLTLRDHLALYKTVPMLLGLAGQLAYAAFPMMRE